MSTPEHSPLPWHIKDKVAQIYDANHDPVFVSLPANRRLIIAAVNTNAELLAAAKTLYQAVHGDTVAVGPLWGRLHAAIALAEEHTP